MRRRKIDPTNGDNKTLPGGSLFRYHDKHRLQKANQKIEVPNCDQVCCPKLDGILTVVHHKARWISVVYLAGHSTWLPCGFTGENGSREIDARKGGTSHPNGLVLDGEHALSDLMLFGEGFAKQATTISTIHTVKQIKEMKKLNVPQ